MVWNSENVYGYCIYLSLVWKLLSLCLWHVFNTNLQIMRHIGVELLYVLHSVYKQVAVGSIDPFGLLRITAKNFTHILSNFLVNYLGCVITKINKCQKISACFVNYVLFILENTKQKGLIDSFGLFRIKVAQLLTKYAQNKLLTLTP